MNNKLYLRIKGFLLNERKKNLKLDNITLNCSCSQYKNNHNFINKLYYSIKKYIKFNLKKK